MNPPDLMSVVRSNLAEAVHELKITPTEVSRASGQNESMVRDIIRGRSQNPGIVSLWRICEVLGIRPEALWADYQPTPPEPSSDAPSDSEGVT